MYWGALSTGISEPIGNGRVFLIRAGSEGGISFADPFGGGLASLIPRSGSCREFAKPCAFGASVFYFRSQKASFRAPEIKKPTINRGFCKFSAVRAGLASLIPLGGGFSADHTHFPAVFHVGDFGACPTSLNQRFDSAGMLQKKTSPRAGFSAYYPRWR